jgi:hypothetical protein
MYMFHHLLLEMGGSPVCHSSVLKKLPCLQCFRGRHAAFVLALYRVSDLGIMMQLKIRVIDIISTPRRSLKSFVAHREHCASLVSASVRV